MCTPNKVLISTRLKLHTPAHKSSEMRHGCKWPSFPIHIKPGRSLVLGAKIRPAPQFFVESLSTRSKPVCSRKSFTSESRHWEADFNFRHGNWELLKEQFLSGRLNLTTYKVWNRNALSTHLMDENKRIVVGWGIAHGRKKPTHRAVYWVSFDLMNLIWACFIATHSRLAWVSCTNRCHSQKTNKLAVSKWILVHGKGKNVVSEFLYKFVICQVILKSIMSLVHAVQDSNHFSRTVSLKVCYVSQMCCRYHGFFGFFLQFRFWNVLHTMTWQQQYPKLKSSQAVTEGEQMDHQIRKRIGIIFLKQ